MKHTVIIIFALWTLLVLFGCSVNSISDVPFEESNHVFFERTVDDLQIGDALSAKVSKGSKLAIRSMEVGSPSDQPLFSILEDQMLQSLLQAGYLVVERDNKALGHLIKESNNDTFSIQKDNAAWMKGKDITIGKLALKHNNQGKYDVTNLTAADYILSYRVQECGILFEPIEKISTKVTRNGLVRLHLRVVDAKTGAVVYTRNITGSNSDQVLISSMSKLANFHYIDIYPYSYPLQPEEISQQPIVDQSAVPSLLQNSLDLAVKPPLISAAKTKSQINKSKGLKFQFNLGLDTSGEHEISYDSGSETFDLASGYSPGLEMLFIGNRFIWGFGAEYQLMREIKAGHGMTVYENPNVSFIPIYLTAKYKIPLTRKLSVEANTQFGYNLFEFDDKYAPNGYDGDYDWESSSEGGLYSAIGVDFVLSNHFITQLLFKSNTAVLHIEGNSVSYYYSSFTRDLDIKQNQVQLGLGYRF